MKITKNILKSLVIAGAIISTTSLLASEGSTLYKKCAACHGSTANKHALGKSKIIANMSEKELNVALNGYKDGTYGGRMKGLMKGQVIALSEKDIKVISNYITTLKK